MQSVKPCPIRPSSIMPNPIRASSLRTPNSTRTSPPIRPNSIMPSPVMRPGSIVPAMRPGSMQTPVSPMRTSPLMTPHRFAPTPIPISHRQLYTPSRTITQYSSRAFDISSLLITSPTPRPSSCRPPSCPPQQQNPPQRCFSPFIVARPTTIQMPTDSIPTTHIVDLSLLCDSMTRTNPRRPGQPPNERTIELDLTSIITQTITPAPLALQRCFSPPQRRIVQGMPPPLSHSPTPSLMLASAGRPASTPPQLYFASIRFKNTCLLTKKYQIETRLH